MPGTRDNLPYGYRRRRPRKHGGEILAICLAICIPIYIYSKLTSSAARSELANIYMTIVALVSWLSMIIDTLTPLICCIPTVVVSMVYVSVTTDTGPKRINVVFWISISPLVLIFGLFSGIVLVLWAQLLFEMVVWRCFPTVVYLISFGSVVIRVPRFRGRDRFKNSQLCARCKQVVTGSNLLSGTWGLLTKANEEHVLYDNIEEMEDNGCSICEGLLSQRIIEEADTGMSIIARGGYGTMHQARGGYPRAVDRNSPVKLKLGFAKNSVWSTEEPTVAVTLNIGVAKQPFREVQISEGTLRKEKTMAESTGSEATIATIKIWLDTCCQKHTACQNPHSSTTPFLPTRLIKVGTVSKPTLRLINTRRDLQGSEHHDYIALSHCWGGEIASKLTSTNYAQLWASIPEDWLPQNFLDAINITRRLGISYLWIDSLCIFQDSPVDWAAESPTMGHVYSNAICVLAATASPSSDGGCFRQRSLTSAEVNIMTSKARRCFLFNPPPIRAMFHWRVEQSPLANRAWAFQERLLAKRVVHFCSDIVLFECNSTQASELHVKGTAYETEPYLLRDGRLVERLGHLLWVPSRSLATQTQSSEKLAVRGIRGALDVLQSLGPAEKQTFGERVEFYKRWYEIVSVYSRGELTRQTDKLVAIAGVAELVQNSSRLPYLAGLWDSDMLILGLLWVVKNPQKKLDVYCAPSWSWASVKGRIGFLPRASLGGIVDQDKERLNFQSAMEWAKTFRRGEPVSNARSLVENGKLCMWGETATGQLSENGRLRLKCIDGRVTYLTWWKDWHFDEQQWASAELLAVHLLTTRSMGGSKIYGLVLRQIVGEGHFERVGAWTMMGDISERVNFETQKLVIM